MSRATAEAYPHSRLAASSPEAVPDDDRQTERRSSLARPRTARRSEPRRISVSRRPARTPRWFWTATCAWAGASSARPRSCCRSRAGAATRRTSPHSRTGASRCFFPGKGLRRRGVADAARGGALAEISRHGGGTVEGYPEETDDRKLSGSLLHTGPMAAFEKHGFTRTRPTSPHRWVVTRNTAERACQSRPDPAMTEFAVRGRGFVPEAVRLSEHPIVRMSDWLPSCQNLSVAGLDLDLDVAGDDEPLARDCFRVLRRTCAHFRSNFSYYEVRNARRYHPRLRRQATAARAGVYGLCARVLRRSSHAVGRRPQSPTSSSLAPGSEASTGEWVAQSTWAPAAEHL